MSELSALVVDDSPAMRRNVVQALHRIAIRCSEAQDGAEGLKRYTENRYDLVVTDINMPLMDGLKLISAIRQLPEGTKVPIVVITTEAAQEDRERALKLGASAYLIKPVQAKTVQDAVRDLLGLS